MTLPVRIDRTLWRGDNAPSLGWQFPDDFAVAGSDYVLAVSVGSQGILTADTYSGSLTIVGNVGGRVIWSPTTDQTALIPLGTIAEYTLQRQVSGGEQRTYVYGFINAQGAA